MIAGNEALARGQHFIGTEHLLLALAVERDGIAAQILDGLRMRNQVTDTARRFLDDSGTTGGIAGNASDEGTIMFDTELDSNYAIKVSIERP